MVQISGDKKIVFRTLLFLIFTTFTTVGTFAAEETIAPELKASLNQHIYEPNFFGIVFSLLLVICLIYATGIAYQKLVKLNPKYLKQDIDLDKNEFNIISTKPLGQGKFLHVVEINKKLLVLGSTSGGINLLREFSKEEVV